MGKGTVNDQDDQQRRPEPGENPPAWADAVYDAVQQRLAAEQDES